MTDIQPQQVDSVTAQQEKGGPNTPSAALARPPSLTRPILIKMEIHQALPGCLGSLYGTITQPTHGWKKKPSCHIGLMPLAVPMPLCTVTQTPPSSLVSRVLTPPEQRGRQSPNVIATHKLPARQALRASPSSPLNEDPNKQTNKQTSPLNCLLTPFRASMPTTSSKQCSKQRPSTSLSRTSALPGSAAARLRYPPLSPEPGRALDSLPRTGPAAYG